jgi:hypothetical protein
MLRFTALVIAVALFPISVRADYPTNVKEAIDVIVLFCVAGGKENKVSVDAKVEGGLSVKKPGVTGGAGISISQSQAKGLVEGLRGEMNKITGEQASEARQCMKPYIDRIVNILLEPPKPASVPPAPRPPISSQASPEPAQPFRAARCCIYRLGWCIPWGSTPRGSDSPAELGSSCYCQDYPGVVGQDCQ